MSNTPSPTPKIAFPSPLLVDPYITGYLMASLEKHGQITVASWNRAVEAATELKANAPKKVTR